MIGNARYRILLLGLGGFVFLALLLHRPIARLAQPIIILQTEKQTDMTNVQFPVAPPNRYQLANMRYQGLDPSKVATMTELRHNPQMVPHLLHMLNVLDEDWPFRIYHSRENADLFNARPFRKHIKTGKLVLVEVNVDLGNHAAVSDYLAHRAYWDNLAPAKNVLVFQTDSILCSRSEARVEDFFEYDYIGAPVHERLYGTLEDKWMNGGLSLRNRETMLNVIENSAPFNHPDNDETPFEDQFFVKRIRDMGGNLPSRETAMNFSVESIYYPTPLGIHQANRYLDSAGEGHLYRQLTNQWCPETHLLYGKSGPEAFMCDASSPHFDAEGCVQSGGVLLEPLPETPPPPPVPQEESPDIIQEDHPIEAPPPVPATLVEHTPEIGATVLDTSHVQDGTSHVVDSNPVIGISQEGIVEELDPVKQGIAAPAGSSVNVLKASIQR